MPTPHVYPLVPTYSDMAQKRKLKNEYENEIDDFKPKKIPRTLAEKDAQKRLIVVLENASLETIKV